MANYCFPFFFLFFLLSWSAETARETGRFLRGCMAVMCARWLCKLMKQIYQREPMRVFHSKNTLKWVSWWGMCFKVTHYHFHPMWQVHIPYRYRGVAVTRSLSHARLWNSQDPLLYLPISIPQPVSLACTTLAHRSPCETRNLQNPAHVRSPFRSDNLRFQ